MVCGVGERVRDGCVLTRSVYEITRVCAGVLMSSSEMALFQLAKEASGPSFKAISALAKEKKGPYMVPIQSNL